MKILGLRPWGFKTIETRAFGSGDPIKVKVKRSLLSPSGKDIVATLRFNGTTVYLPKDTSITIGSSPVCEITIKDPYIESNHLMITSHAGGISVSNLTYEKTIAVINQTMPQPKMLSSNDSEFKIQGDSGIALELGGTNSSLIVDVQPKTPTDEALKIVLTQELTLKPPIVQVLPGEASEGIKEKSGMLATNSIPVDQKLVASTHFYLAKTYDDLFNLYLAENKRYDKKEAKQLAAIVGSGSLMAISGFLYVVSNPAYGYVTLLGALVFLISLISYVKPSDTAEKKRDGFEKGFKKILSSLFYENNGETVVNELIKLPPDKRDTILSGAGSGFRKVLKHAIKKRKHAIQKVHPRAPMSLPAGSSQSEILKNAQLAAKQKQKN